MEISDFIKILFGATVGFAGGWFQSWLRRDEERLRLHREKLETLYSMVNEWGEATGSLFAECFGRLWVKEDLKTIIQEAESRIDHNRMKVIIRFYAIGLLSQYEACRNSFDEFVPAIMESQHDNQYDRLKLSYEEFYRKSLDLENAIVSEGEKYIPQSFTDRCKSLIAEKWKPKALR